MLICAKDQSTDQPPLISGNLYQRNGSDLVYIYFETNKVLVNLQYGTIWSVEGYGDTKKHSDVWKNVTSEFCLKRIS